jgi:hypothetical protein
MMCDVPSMAVIIIIIIIIRTLIMLEHIYGAECEPIVITNIDDIKTRHFAFRVVQRMYFLLCEEFVSSQFGLLKKAHINCPKHSAVLLYRRGLKFATLIQKSCKLLIYIAAF